VPSAFGVSTLAWYNDIAYNLLLPLSVLLLLLFVGWEYAGDATAELELGAGVGPTFGTVWLWLVRTVVPVGVLVTLLLGIQSLAVKAGLLAQPLV
jgi:NSS family neurotransmitter:Na+ symporter